MRNKKECPACGTCFDSPPSSGKVYCSAKCRKKCLMLGTHGDSYKRLYGIWSGMKARCKGSTCENVRKYYADRGIVVCEEWRSSYVAFRKWATENGYADHLQLDRIDNGGDYSPSNCRWVTRSQQMANTRKRKDAKTSKYKGVSWCANTRSWRVQIMCDGAHYHVGLYRTEEEAAKAYNQRAVELFGECAALNLTSGGVPF